MNVLSVTQIAARLGLSRERIYQLINKGRFPESVGEIGRTAVYREVEVARWAKRSGRKWT